eukprot:TRINITY_DN1195_c0_g1_i1.p1 TRINITY_DN1195_c0_g1~~TRINITY_DN1195_c0_g1_i1.p1  ORF type:complete len:190 (+),score=42.25 TRINITY_DN1195_c0_g1_i1:142-711(+)
MSIRVVGLALLFVCALTTGVLEGGHVVRGRVNTAGVYDWRVPGEIEDFFSARVTLNHVEYQTYLKRDGTFIFNNVKPGEYILQVHSRLVEYDPIFVKVDVNGVFQSQVISSKTRKVVRDISHPFLLETTQRIEYTPPKDTSLWGIIKNNPTMITIGVSVLFVFIMKKMPSMDELQQAGQVEQSQPAGQR